MTATALLQTHQPINVIPNAQALARQRKKRKAGKRAHTAGGKIELETGKRLLYHTLTSQVKSFGLPRQWHYTRFLDTCEVLFFSHANL